MQDEKLQTAGEEISLKDIVDFLKGNWKRIALLGMVGLLSAAAYIALIPAPEKKYEATWQIQMAQFSKSNSEEPAALVQRLRSPTAYPVEVQRSCGMPEDGEFSDYLGGKLEIHRIKDVPTTVDMKLYAANPSQAKQCAEAIVTMIMAQQRGLIEERLAGYQEQVVQHQQSLAQEQQQLEKIKMSTLSKVGYWARLDKLSWLRSQIGALQEEIFLSRRYPAKLTAPIYVPSKPIPTPSKAMKALPLGTLFGLMLGVLYALGREAWRKSV